ncbi:MAG: M1 family metallopeptidase [Melioribacteraceae bacterium]|nr:M1 family metallopeptidase [Melioribacteraceae bacterium]
MNKKSLVIIAIFSLTLLTSFCGVMKVLDYKNIQPKVLFAGVRTFVNDLFSDTEYVTAEQSRIDVLHYDLKIALLTKKEKIKGDVTITLLNPITNNLPVVLNFYENMEVSELLLNGSETEFTRDDYHLIINKNEVQTDTVVINVKYEGTPKRLGFDSFSFDKYKGESVVYTLNEPTYASTWFPCNDIPSDKAFADIYITNDSSKTSVSNGILVEEKFADDLKTAHWKTIYRISTYLIAIYSADYELFTDTFVSESGDSMNLQYYVFEDDLEDAKLDFANQKDILAFFESKFGEYPFIKEKYGIAEFLWQSGAMEHQTITGIGTNFITGRKMFNDILIHELAHHWWGNAVGPMSWKDVWLNEGFATYSEALYYEHESGRNSLISTMNSKFSKYYDKRLYDTEGSLFSGTIYNKGAWVLHMLRREVGDENFFKILRNYFETYKYKNASTNDFIKVCENISDKNLKQFFEQWVTIGSEVLQIEYSWKFNQIKDGKFKVELEIKQTQNDYEPYEFSLDINFSSETESISKTLKIDKKESKIDFILDFKPAEVKLDKDSWLFAEIDMNENGN